MNVKLLTEHHLEGAAQARLTLHLSKCHIVWKSRVAAQMIMGNCFYFTVESYSMRLVSVNLENMSWF